MANGEGRIGCRLSVAELGGWLSARAYKLSVLIKHFRAPYITMLTRHASLILPRVSSKLDGILENAQGLSSKTNKG
jgi:hypothetical protein